MTKHPHSYELSPVSLIGEWLVEVYAGPRGRHDEPIAERSFDNLDLALRWIAVKVQVEQSYAREEPGSLADVFSKEDN